MTSVFSRGISHAIHGPLPLDPAKTKRLLAALTASFQRHLDAAHPTPSTPPPPSVSASPHPHASSAFHASASHYTNILQHPAFASLAHSRQSGELTIPAILHRLQAQLLQDAPSALAVEACLAALVQRSAASPSRDLAAKVWAMFRAGNRVSMLHERSAAAKDFGRLALRENQPELAHRLARQAPSDATVRVAMTAAFLLERGPNDALRFVVSIFNGDVPVTLDQAYGKCLRLVCRYLLAHPEEVGQVTPAVYNDVLRESRRWDPKITRFDRLTLGLFNPGAPKCEPALALVQETASQKLDNWTAPYRRAFIRFSFRLAQLLIQHGRYEDADFVLNFCRNAFPGELASAESHGRRETDESVLASKVAGLLGI